MRSFCLILALVLLVSACGQKGPLYLPDQKPAKKDRTKQ
jgi:predicted small lipoprotein YifL